MCKNDGGGVCGGSVVHSHIPRERVYCTTDAKTNLNVRYIDVSKVAPFELIYAVFERL